MAKASEIHECVAPLSTSAYVVIGFRRGKERETERKKWLGDEIEAMICGDKGNLGAVAGLGAHAPLSSRTWDGVGAPDAGA